jgi:hypothetical protein
MVKIAICSEMVAARPGSHCPIRLFNSVPKRNSREALARLQRETTLRNRKILRPAGAICRPDGLTIGTQLLS